MAFSDFHYPELLPTFGLVTGSTVSLFGSVQPVAAGPELVHRLAVGKRLATLINTEKARSEGLIAPVLLDFWWLYQARISLYSGCQFDADADAGLCGYCDFLISRHPQQPYITPPTVVVFEAKRENIIDGFGQAVAGMVGAQRFNRKQNTSIDPVYGCITTGTAWKFLQLAGNTVVIDLDEYEIAQVDSILGILAHMVGPIPQPAAA